MKAPKTRVIMINGIANSGKDTFVKYVEEYCTMDDSANVLNISSVDPIKNMLRQFGWDGNKIPMVRNIIADIKGIWTADNNGPTMYLLNNILEFHKTRYDEDNIIFCHIREKGEIDKLGNILCGMDRLGIEFMTMYVERPDNDCYSSCDVDNIIINHPCDYYDIMISNSKGLNDLKKAAEEFVDKLLGGNYDE